jgi:hypothetical protein
VCNKKIFNQSDSWKIKWANVELKK